MTTGVPAIRYMVGDATEPAADGPAIIAHVCNDVGGWSLGFVRALSERWPEPERAYLAWWRAGERDGFRLGAIQVVEVGPDLWVANMIGQHDVEPSSSGPPIRYPALEKCLSKLAGEAVTLGASVHMPRIGCGLAGGDWRKVEPLIQSRLSISGVEVTVYDRPDGGR